MITTTTATTDIARGAQCYYFYNDNFYYYYYYCYYCYELMTDMFSKSIDCQELITNLPQPYTFKVCVTSRCNWFMFATDSKIA